MKKKAVVVHSGGMDSSICLAYAIQAHGVENVLSLTFDYNQRHSTELVAAKKICRHFNVDQTILPIHCLKEITEDALLNHEMKIETVDDAEPNTLVVGRNGLMARLASIHAHHLGAKMIYMGVIEVEEANSGYRDCSRDYMDLMQKIMRIDLDDINFEIRTPLVYMTKCETLKLANKLNVLNYFLENSVTCYNGIPNKGCGKCPACILKNEGIKEYYESNI